MQVVSLNLLPTIVKPLSDTPPDYRTHVLLLSRGSPLVLGLLRGMCIEEITTGIACRSTQSCFLGNARRLVCIVKELCRQRFRHLRCAMCILAILLQEGHELVEVLVDQGG